MNDDFEDRMRSMLIDRAESAAAEPDLQRVLADATRRSSRPPAERLVFLAAVAAILAVLVSVGVVLGSRPSEEQAVIEPRSAGEQDDDATLDSVRTTTTTAVETTLAQTTGPATTAPPAECVVITTEGAGGSMVEVLTCPTTEPGPGASLICGTGQVTVTGPDCSTITTDEPPPTPSPTPTPPEPTGSLPICDITTIPGDNCIRNGTTGSTGPAPTPPLTPPPTGTCSPGTALTTIWCPPLSVRTTGTIYAGSSSAPPPTPTTGP